MFWLNSVFVVVVSVCWLVGWLLACLFVCLALFGFAWFVFVVVCLHGRLMSLFLFVCLFVVLFFVNYLFVQDHHYCFLLFVLFVLVLCLFVCLFVLLCMNNTMQCNSNIYMTYLRACIHNKETRILRIYNFI